MKNLSNLISKLEMKIEKSVFLLFGKKSLISLTKKII